jgi:glutamine amidotransferase
LIVIVDYGVGNISAIINMLDYLGVEAISSNEHKEIQNANGLILPGVGAFDRAMRSLREQKLIELLNDLVLIQSIPVLGICLGMQILARRSDEGTEPGLGWLSADVRKIAVKEGSQLKIPHIGWSETTNSPTNPLFSQLAGPQRYYFNHSFHMVCDNANDVISTFDFDQVLTCGVNNKNIFGVQFHPEKSHKFGMRILQSFVSIVESKRS